MPGARAKLGVFILVSACVAVALFPSTLLAREPLILAVHPYLPAKELNRRFSPLADYLSKELGQPVAVRVGGDYWEHIEYIGKDQVDIAFMGPASYVKMVAKYGNKPLLARLEIRGRPQFQGKIIVRKDSPLQNLPDLQGHSFAFGDPGSTMSYQVPRYMLWRAGITLDALSDHQFLGSHNNVALGVLAGDFDAGAVKEEVFLNFESHGLRALASSPALSEHLFVASDTLPASVVKALRAALYHLKDAPNGAPIMNAIKKDMSAMVPAVDSDYDSLREILNTLETLDS